MMRKGFSLTEMAIAAGLLVALLFVLMQLFSFASSYVSFGMAKLDRTSRLRLAVESLKIDIREAGSDIAVADSGQTLKIGRFASAAGLPAYDNDGMPEHGEFTEYRFVTSGNASGAGILYRNRRILMDDVRNVEFALHQETVNEVQLVRVVTTFEQQSQKGELFKTVLHLSPRHLASWVRDPFWTSVSNDRRFKYQFGARP